MRHLVPDTRVAKRQIENSRDRGEGDERVRVASIYPQWHLLQAPGQAQSVDEEVIAAIERYYGDWH